MQMARLSRVSLKGFAQHIIQRGNNHLPCFFGADDYEQYLDYLSDAMDKYGVILHSYCLMPNHVHLLMTPESSDGISRALQDLGRRYVRYINFKYNRTGTLWEGRYHSCLIENNSHVMDCYRYIESNPIRSKISEGTQLYKWSSYNCNALNKTDCFVVPHAEYLKLGKDSKSRCSAYQSLMGIELEADKVKNIREATQSNRVYGSDNFIYWIENELSIKIRKKKAGRPRLSQELSVN